MNGYIQNNNVSPFDSASNTLSKSIRYITSKTPEKIKAEAQEIRVRANLPLVLYCGKKSYFYDTDGNILSKFYSNLFTPTINDIKESFNNICNFSVYSYQNELKQGFITIKGGHRVGICATAVYQNDKISTIRNITSLNVRIARQIIGSSTSLLAATNFCDGGVLIAGAPSSGKTTVLRDLSRALSLKMKKVVVIDERGELAAISSSSIQNNLGLCDVLNEYLKVDAMEIAIRALSPDIIVCDELGNKRELEVIVSTVNAGVNIIATIHSSTYEELIKKKYTKELLETGAFKYIVILESSLYPGKIKSIHKLGD